MSQNRIRRAVIRVCFGLFVGSGVGGGLAEALAGETALDRYVARPDPTYSFKVQSETEKNGGKQFVVALKSQTWRTKEEVDRTVWEHWIVIAKPARVASKTAFLFIGGGKNRPEPPKGAD